MANLTFLLLTNQTSDSNFTDAHSNSTVPPVVNRARALPWNNPSNIMTKETSDEITFAFQCFIFPIFTVFGITGNILSMIVMLQKSLRNSTTTIVLVGLAVSDILFLATNMIRKSTCIIKEYDPLLADEINAKTFRYAFYLKTSFSRVSTLLVVVISFERLIAVAFPLKVKSLITKPRMVAAVISCNIIVLACLAGLPPQYTHATVGGRVYISQTEFSLNNVDSLKIYNEYFLPIAFRYIPVLLVLFSNIAIVIVLRRSRQFQNKSASKDNKRDEDQRKITQMLLTVSVIYLICLIPGDVLLIASDAIEGFGFFGIYHNAFLALSDISLFFEVINSSINFIIYMVLNRRFSDMYKKLFCSCVRHIHFRRSGSTTKSLSRSTAATKETGTNFSATVDKNDPSLSTSGYGGSDKLVSTDADTSSTVQDGCDNPAFNRWNAACNVTSVCKTLESNIVAE